MDISQHFISLVNNHLLAGIFIFIVLRAATIVFAPLPGAVIDILGIQAFGWLRAFLLGEIGIMIGAMTAFYLARKLREPIIKRFASLRKIKVWEEKLTDTEQFWAWIVLRLLTNPGFDYISYAAGLSRCRTSVFFFSTLLGNIPTVLAFYYFSGLGLRYWSTYGIALFLAVAIIATLISSKYLRRQRNSKQNIE